MTPPEAAQECPQSGWRLHRTAQHPPCPAGAQCVRVVYAVATCQSRRHKGQYLVSRIRPARRIPQVKVAVRKFAQTQSPGEGDRQEQSGIGHQAVIVESCVDAVGTLGCYHLFGAPRIWLVLCPQTIIPDSGEHLFNASADIRQPLLRWIGAKQHRKFSPMARVLADE